MIRNKVFKIFGGKSNISKRAQSVPGQVGEGGTSLEDRNQELNLEAGLDEEEGE